MKEHFNSRLSLILLAALVLGTGATFLLHSWQRGRHARTLMTQARQAEMESHLDRAALYLQRYLVFAPDDNAARATCGLLMEQLATSTHERWRVATVYEQVLYRDPSRHDIRRRMALLAVELGWYAEACEHLKILIRDQPGQGDLEGLLGLCQENSGDCQLAVRSYQNAIRHAPRQVDTYVRLANLFQYRLDRPKNAVSVLDDLVRNNNQSYRAYLARAAHRMRLGSLADAGRDMARARELASDNPHVLLVAADLARRLGRLDEARACLRHGCERDPHHVAMHLALASLERGLNHQREAIDCLRQGLQALPDEPNLLHLLAETLIECGDEPAAEEAIQRLQLSGAPPGLAHYLDGQLQLKRKKWIKAICILEEVVQLPDSAAALASRASLTLGQCYEQLGDSDRQLTALRKATALDPSSAPARLALAAALRSAGQTDEALEQYREVVQLPQAPDEGWVLLGRLLVQRNRSLPSRKRNWREVERIVERAAQLPTLEVPLAILRADVLIAREHPDQARSLLEQTVAAYPDQADLWTALADVALRQGQSERSAQILEDARRRLNNRIELYQAELTLCSLRKPRQARETLRKLENELYRLQADERMRLLAQIAATCYQLGQNADGQRLRRLLAEQAPTDLSSRLPLLELALQSTDETLLAGLVADVRRLEGEEGTWWRYGEAAWLILRAQRGDHNGLNRARALTADLLRRRPNWSRGVLLEAYLADLNNESARAADAYLRAFRQRERRPEIVDRLARLLAGQGRFDEAGEVIRQFQQQAALSADLARLGAEIALRQRGTERALELARLAVPTDSSDYRKLIWFGQMLALVGRPNESEEVLRQAVRLRDDLAETWIALVAHLAKSDQLHEAEEVLNDMRRRLPSDQTPLALAICAEVLDQRDSAEQYYRRALAHRPDDGIILQRAARFYLRLNQFQEAEPLLRRMLVPEANVPGANQAWARHQLALILAFDGDEAKYRQALALLDENRRQKQDTVADLRARLLVQATRAEERPSAMQLLEKSSKTQPFTGEELFRLMQLYEADNDASKAREKMLELLSVDKNNPELLAYHIGQLLRHDQRDEARPWIARLRRLEPDSSRVQTFLASLTKK